MTRVNSRAATYSTISTAATVPLTTSRCRKIPCPAKREQRRHQQSGHGQDQRGRVHRGRARVVGLFLVLQAAQQEGQPEDQQQVPDDRARERRLHDLGLVLQDQEERDHELGDVAERRVDQPADPRARVERELLGRPPDQSGQRQDRAGRDHEDQQFVAAGDLEDDGDRDEDQQPVQRGAELRHPRSLEPRPARRVTARLGSSPWTRPRGSTASSPSGGRCSRRPEEYAEEAEDYRRLLVEGSAGEAREVLELGSGGGNNASHLKAHFRLTLVDRSPQMLA